MSCMNALNVYAALERISEDEAVLLGFEPQVTRGDRRLTFSKPSDLMLSVQPIGPQCIRPSSETFEGEEARSKSALTRQIEKILRLSCALRKHAGEFQEHFEHLVMERRNLTQAWIGRELLEPLALFLMQLDAYWIERNGLHYNETTRTAKSLVYVAGKSATQRKKSQPVLLDQHAREQLMRVALREVEFTYYHLQEEVCEVFKSSGKGKKGQRGSGKSNSSVRSELSGKGGALRRNATGKRRVGSGRTVISSDPDGHMAWAGLPEQIAITLTYAETVTVFNVHRLTVAVHNGPQRYPGANAIIRGTPHGEETTDLRFLDTAMIVLQLGWKVERHMITGDAVILNRQPSLHRMNMGMFWIAVLAELKVLTISMFATTPYGADFDGDEMTIHTLKSPGSQSRGAFDADGAPHPQSQKRLSDLPVCLRHRARPVPRDETRHLLYQDYLDGLSW